MCTLQFSTRELKVRSRQCLRRYWEERMRKAWWQGLPAGVQRDRIQEMEWMRPLNCSQTRRKSSSAMPNRPSTSSLLSLFLRIQPKMALAKFFTIFLVSVCLRLSLLLSVLKLLFSGPYSGELLISPLNSTFLSGFWGARGLVGFWMMRTLFLEDLGSLSWLELELNCSRLLNYLQPETLIPLCCWCVEPEPESELENFLLSSWQSRVWRSSSFMMRMFCALMTCIISAVTPRGEGSLVAKSVSGTSSLRKAELRCRSSEGSFSIAQFNQLVAKQLLYNCERGNKEQIYADSTITLLFIGIMRYPK